MRRRIGKVQIGVERADRRWQRGIDTEEVIVVGVIATIARMRGLAVVAMAADSVGIK